MLMPSINPGNASATCRLVYAPPDAPVLIAGGLVYAVGMFGVTVFCNVPLNNALAAVDPAAAEAASTWARYLKEWTLWNHVRTVTSTVAAILFTVALGLRPA